MKSIILTTAALLVAMCVTFTGSAEAKVGKGGGKQWGKGPGPQQIHFHTYARGYNSWGRIWYNPDCGCYWYFSAEYNEWFYYYAPQGLFLPVSEIAIYPPVAVVNGAMAVAPAGPMPAMPMPAAPLPSMPPMPTPG